MLHSVRLVACLLISSCLSNGDRGGQEDDRGAEGTESSEDSPDSTGTLGDSSSDDANPGESSSGGGPEEGSSTDDGDADSGGGVCGNGILEAGEECDDGNSIDGDACESDCTLPACDNGIIDLYEMCLPTSGESFQVSGSPQALALGDLDEDGLFDLVVRLGDGSLVRLLQRADGTFAGAEGLEGRVSRVALNDVDADGHLDVLGLHNLLRCPNELCLPNGSSISIRLGHGDGRFSDPEWFPVGTRGADWALGDINDDSSVDIVVADLQASEIHVLLNSGDDRLLLPAEAVDSPVPLHAIAIGDLNRDWIPDLVAASKGAGAASVEVFLATGDGTFVHELSLPAGDEVYDLATIDLQPNGALDILTTDPVRDQIHVQVGEPDQLFPSRVDLEADGVPTHLWVGDVDGHGHADVATAREDARVISLSIGVGAIESWWIHTVELEGTPGAPEFADINGDGAVDFAVPLPAENLVTIVLARP